jgi:hypothetical protein
VSVNRDLRRVVASSKLPIPRPRLAAIGLCGLALAGGAGLAWAQGISEQQMRCMQLQEELAAVQRGGGANPAEIARLDQQIAQQDRVFQGTQAAMKDAGCFESFLIFGRALKRNPRCLNMNARVEDARRQLTQLQHQRQALSGGRGSKRRQAELNDAMARAGCAGVRTTRRGGLFDFFGGGADEPELPREQLPVYRNVDPNGRYRTVCVRLCDGFYFPISYSVSGYRVGEDAQRCQANCAAPAELYVYRNPGQEIEQAFSLQGSAYMDLPVALKYRKEYVKGCSCKQAEYNPTQIEAANKQATAEPAAPAESAPAPAAADGPPPKLEIDIGAGVPAAPAAPAEAPTEAVPVPQQAAPAPQAPQDAPAPQADIQIEPPGPGQSTMMKSRTPAPTPQ